MRTLDKTVTAALYSRTTYRLVTLRVRLTNDLWIEFFSISVHVLCLSNRLIGAWRGYAMHMYFRHYLQFYESTE